MIDREHQLSVTQQVKLLDVSLAVVYYRATPLPDRDLAPILDRRHVTTLMRRMGIEALCPKPGTDKRGRGSHRTVYRYLLRNMCTSEANQVWAIDATSTPMRNGFVYRSGLFDVVTRRALAHKVCTTLEAQHAVEVVEQATARFGTPETVKKRGTKLSMDGKGVWQDIGFFERFWRTAKFERIYERASDTMGEARADVAECIDWYNDLRPNTSLDDRALKRVCDESCAKKTARTMKVAA